MGELMNQIDLIYNLIVEYEWAVRERLTWSYWSSWLKPGLSIKYVELLYCEFNLTFQYCMSL